MEKNKSNIIDHLEPNELAENIFNADISSLSRGITLIESSSPKHWSAARELVDLCLPKSGNSIRIGITGVPGVGKSTFIESFGNYLVTNNHKVAVLAVDPSSSETKGSILGDKTRMASLSINPNAYIRPSAAGTTLGGVARKTREAIILCEAAGYDMILIETVGVGQSEVAVHSMVDFFLLLKLAGAGDELQGIKRGIIEMADLIAINKADGENLKEAKKAQREFKNALHLLPPRDSGLETQVLLCSALENSGIKEIYSTVLDSIAYMKDHKLFFEKRNQQQIKWLRQSIEERLTSEFYNNKKIKDEYPKQVELIKQKKTTAFAAANYLLGL